MHSYLMVQWPIFQTYCLPIYVIYNCAWIKSVISMSAKCTICSGYFNSIYGFHSYWKYNKIMVMFAYGRLSGRIRYLKNQQVKFYTYCKYVSACVTH